MSRGPYTDDAVPCVRMLCVRHLAAGRNHQGLDGVLSNAKRPAIRSRAGVCLCLWGANHGGRILHLGRFRLRLDPDHFALEEFPYVGHRARVTPALCYAVLFLCALRRVPLPA